ncbi:MAG: hypothetical protein KDD68_17985 [Bdellovibrionales bacterium]|nr:hypothetical protein [Bdellovibrionales bacterium]
MKQLRSVEKMMRLDLDANLLSEISGALEAEDYKRAILMCEKRVKKNETPNLLNRDFYYLLGAAYDYDGRSMEAFAIFKTLAERYPLFPDFTQSMLVCAQGILVQMSQHLEMTGNIEESDIENFYNWARDNYFVPARILQKYCEILIKRGKKAEARRLVEEFLVVYPHDYAFLRLARELATLAQDEIWQQDITERLTAILDRYPWQISLYALLPKESSSGPTH